MVYFAALYCNANIGKNKVTCSVVVLVPYGAKKQTSSRRSIASFAFARFDKTCFDCDPDQRRWQPWVILVLKSLSKI